MAIDWLSPKPFAGEWHPPQVLSECSPPALSNQRSLPRLAIFRLIGRPRRVSSVDSMAPVKPARSSAARTSASRASDARAAGEKKNGNSARSAPRTPTTPARCVRALFVMASSRVWTFLRRNRPRVNPLARDAGENTLQLLVGNRLACPEVQHLSPRRVEEIGKVDKQAERIGELEVRDHEAGFELRDQHGVVRRDMPAEHDLKSLRLQDLQDPGKKRGIQAPALMLGEDARIDHVEPLRARLDSRAPSHELTLAVQADTQTVRSSHAPRKILCGGLFVFGQVPIRMNFEGVGEDPRSMLTKERREFVVIEDRHRVAGNQ